MSFNSYKTIFKQNEPCRNYYHWQGSDFVQPMKNLLVSDWLIWLQSDWLEAEPVMIWAESLGKESHVHTQSGEGLQATTEVQYQKQTLPEHLHNLSVYYSAEEIRCVFDDI